MLKVLCVIDGDKYLFEVDINDSETFSDIQKNIKIELPRFNKVETSDLSLYKAPEGIGMNTEPGVIVGVKDKIDITSTLRGMFAETNTIQVIVRLPRYNRSPLDVVQYDSRSGDLIWNQDSFKSFPVHGVSNFKALRQRADSCFFDKTAFIMALESFREPAPVFFRPRRSGKSLALSTLAHFHGREHLPNYKRLFEISNCTPEEQESV
ncbi:hypothetical protein BGZ49_007469 [Haplosporangium sp. Z 27]|nr:hypothetical protein BGZ49_007469 [Haplosporangium sp. Z 27]